MVDGYRESTESWADALRDRKGRGMRDRVQAVGDRASGLWAAPREMLSNLLAFRAPYVRAGRTFPPGRALA